MGHTKRIGNTRVGAYYYLSTHNFKHDHNHNIGIIVLNMVRVFHALHVATLERLYKARRRWDSLPRYHGPLNLMCPVIHSFPCMVLYIVGHTIGLPVGSQTIHLLALFTMTNVGNTIQHREHRALSHWFLINTM